MKNFMLYFRKFIFYIGGIMKIIGILTISMIVSLIFLQVVSRYVFGRPFAWVEELATYCFIWSVYIGAAYALIKKRQIILTTVTDMLPLQARKVLIVIVNIGLSIFLIQAIGLGFRQFIAETALTTISFPWKISRRYFFSLPYIISMTSMLIAVIYDLLENKFPTTVKE